MLTCAIALSILAGCAVPPRPHPDLTQQIDAAIGAPTWIEFREVGPDGGPIDEPDRSGATLSLTEAIRRAVTSDPGLQAAMARVRIAMAESDQARLLPNPVVSIVLRWGPGFDGKPQIEASLAQDFIEAIQRPRRVSAADNHLRQAAAETVTAALDVTSEAQRQYAAVQASASLLPLHLERLALLDELASIARARLDAGEGTRGDLATIDAQRVELQIEIDMVRLAEREDRLHLARTIGEPGSAADWELENWASPSIGTQPEAAWIDEALRHRPEIQSLAWTLMALGDDQSLLRLLPWEGANAGVDIQRDGDWSSGPLISTPLPVFDTGQAQRARLVAQTMEARHELTRVKRAVVEEVRVAFQSLTASRASVNRVHTELLPLQLERRDIAEAAYRAGQMDITARYLAEQDVRVAQALAVQLEHQAAIALIRLQRAVGGPGVAATLARPPQQLATDSEAIRPPSHTP